MTKPKILVSRRWPEAVETAMKEKYDVTFNISDKPLSTNEFKEALSVYDAILPTVTDKISSDVFSVTNPRTKIFGNYGVGFSHIDIPAAKAAGITVSNTPDVLGRVVEMGSHQQLLEKAGAYYNLYEKQFASVE